MIRKATLDDTEQLIDLLGQLFAIEEDFAADASCQRQGISMLLESTMGVVFVAETNFRVVGMVVGQLMVSTAEGGYSLMVEDLVVDKAYRRRGYGGMLLQAVGRWAEDKGAERMQLLADQYNDSALEYYVKQGWRRTRMICLRTFNSDSRS